jgi:hypothetical protein
LSDNDIRLVHIATAPNETIAMMWLDILRDDGIIALAKGGASGYGLGHNLLNEQYILVREDQTVMAREILDEIEEEDGLILWETS